MTAPREVYKAAFEKMAAFGVELSKREQRAVMIGLDYTWDAAVALVRDVIDGTALQDIQDGTPAEDVLVHARDIEKALGLA